jgi:hypothetical protein
MNKVDRLQQFWEGKHPDAVLEFRALPVDHIIFLKERLWIAQSQIKTAANKKRIGTFVSTAQEPYCQ